MKRILILSLTLLLAFSLGCGKESSEKGKETGDNAVTSGEKAQVKGGLRASLIDPVSKKPVDINTSPYAYVYKETEYYFETEQNMKTFMKDPEKYLQ